MLRSAINYCSQIKILPPDPVKFHSHVQSSRGGDGSGRTNSGEKISGQGLDYVRFELDETRAFPVRNDDWSPER